MCVLQQSILCWIGATLLQTSGTKRTTWSPSSISQLWCIIAVTPSTNGGSVKPRRALWDDRLPSLLPNSRRRNLALDKVCRSADGPHNPHVRRHSGWFDIDQTHVPHRRITTSKHLANPFIQPLTSLSDSADTHYYSPVMPSRFLFCKGSIEMSRQDRRTADYVKVTSHISKPTKRAREG